MRVAAVNEVGQGPYSQTNITCMPKPKPVNASTFFHLLLSNVKIIYTHMSFVNFCLHKAANKYNYIKKYGCVAQSGSNMDSFFLSCARPTADG